MKIEANKNRYSISRHQSKPSNSRRPDRPEKPAKQKSSGGRPRRGLPKISMPKIHLPAVDFSKIPLPRVSPLKLRLPKLKGGPVAYLAAAAALLLLVPAAWLGANLIRHTAPKPLFTESNLPPSPPAESNGYLLISDPRVYGEYAGKDLVDINLFSNAVMMDNFLDTTKAEYAFAKSFVARDDVKKMMGLCRDIGRKPDFCDTTAPDPREAQKVNVFIALHNSMTGSAVARMQEKKYGAAFRLMRDQLDLTARYMRSARSTAGYLASLQSYDKSLGIIKSMLEHWGKSENRGDGIIAAAGEIGGLLQQFNPQQVRLEKIAVFEYVLSHRQAFNPSVQHPEAPVLRTMKWRALAFFDRGLTQQMFDERWKKIYECLKNPSDQNAGELNRLQGERFASGRFWWFRNAAGKKYLDTVQSQVYRLVPESKRWTTTINTRQGDILGIINALKAEQKPEKKLEKKKAGMPRKKGAGKPAK